MAQGIGVAEAARVTTFGLHLTDFRGFDGPLLDGLRETAVATESSGFSSLWLTDHVQHLGPGGPTCPMPESHTVLAALAASTRRLRLGVLATSVLYRQPQLLAKMITTVDVLSGGRAVLGIGVGHPRTETEHRAYGYDFPPVAERMRRLEAALEVIRPMLGPAPEPPNWPAPVRPDGIPILVAGSGERRLLPIAARHADLVNLSFPSGDSLDRVPHKLAVLADHCRAAGRDPATIRATYKAMLCLAPTAEAARAAWDGWRKPRGIGELDSRAGVFVGTPDDVAAQFEPWLRAGIDEFVVELPAAHDPDAVALAGETLAGLGAGGSVAG